MDKTIDLKGYIEQAIIEEKIKEQGEPMLYSQKEFKVYTTESQDLVKILREAVVYIKSEQEKKIYKKIIKSIEEYGVVSIPDFLEFNKKYELNHMNNELKLFSNKNSNIVITKNIEMILKNIKAFTEYKQKLINKRIYFVDISNIENIIIYLPMKFTDNTIRYVDYFHKGRDEYRVIE